MELLVVVGVIVVLIGMLLPSLARAREQAKTVTCLSNLHQIGVAEANYLSEYSNYVLAGYANTSVMLSNGYYADAENYATLLTTGGFLTAPSVSVPNASASALALAPVAAGTSVFRCPSGLTDRISTSFSDNITAMIPNPTPASRLDPITLRPWRTRSLKTGIIIDTWYGINATMSDFSAALAPARRIPDQNNPSNVTVPKVTQIASPSTTVYLADGIFTHFYHDPDRISARHSNRTKTNLLFYDGSAGSYFAAKLPGGMGPNAPGNPSAAFAPSNLRKYPDTWFMLSY